MISILSIVLSTKSKSNFYHIGDVPAVRDCSNGQMFHLNPRTALLRTRVALGGKKSPTSLSRKTTNVFVSNCTLGFSTMAGSKKVS